MFLVAPPVDIVNKRGLFGTAAERGRRAMIFDIIPCCHVLQTLLWMNYILPCAHFTRACLRGCIHCKVIHINLARVNIGLATPDMENGGSGVTRSLHKYVIHHLTSVQMWRTSSFGVKSSAIHDGVLSSSLARIRVESRT